MATKKGRPGYRAALVAFKSRACLELESNTELDSIQRIVGVEIRSFVVNPVDDVLTGVGQRSGISLVNFENTDAFLDIAGVGVALQVVAVREQVQRILDVKEQ